MYMVEYAKSDISKLSRERYGERESGGIMAQMLFIIGKKHCTIISLCVISITTWYDVHCKQPRLGSLGSSTKATEACTDQLTRR